MSHRLEVSKIDISRGGRILIFVFTEALGFPKQHEYAQDVYEFSFTKAFISAEIKLPASPVALKLLHDDDLTSRVRKRWHFLPDKGIGYSNGAKITWRVPTFSEAAFDPDKTSQQTINIQYFFKQRGRK